MIVEVLAHGASLGSLASLGMMKTIKVTIDEPLLKAVDRASKARRTTRSAFIRYAVGQGCQI